MKKRLFLQGLYVPLLSAVITALTVICVSSLFIASKDISINNRSIESEVILVRDGNIIYSTKNISSAELQNVLLVAKDNKLTFNSNGVKYRVSQKNCPDGAILLRLSPVLDVQKGYMLLILFFIIVFSSVYLILLTMTLYKNNNEIIRPLTVLHQRTHNLSVGNLDENIPDEGFGEINLLCKEIETLRLRLKKEVYMKLQKNT